MVRLASDKASSVDVKERARDSVARRPSCHVEISLCKSEDNDDTIADNNDTHLQLKQ